MNVVVDIFVLLIFVGVGQMLMLVMFDMLVKGQYIVQVNWFYVVENGDVYVFVDEVSELGCILLCFIVYIWYCELIEVDCV